MKARAVAWGGAASGGARPVPIAVEGTVARLNHAVRGWIDAELGRGRLFLCAPLLFAAGIVAYFVAPDEPFWPAPLALALTAAAAAWRLREPYGLHVALAAVSVLAAGFAAGAVRTAMSAHPILPAELAAATVTGFVESVERRGRGERLVVLVTRIEPAAPVALTRVRVTTQALTGAQTGQAIAFLARLRPPQDAAAPGLYDFGRDAYFAGIGASGFMLGRPRRAEAGSAPLALAPKVAVDRMRTGLSDRIRSALPGPSGAIADALVTGRRGDIPESLNAALRAAGTYHILSISGFHMALVAALIFALVRGSLALCPAIALRYPTKAIAAAIALSVATFYLILSGAEVATQRSFIMIAIVLAGVMAGRAAFTLRTLAVAALVVMAIAPESLMGPSFQMSFSATLALVCGYGLVRPLAEREAGRSAVGTAFARLSGGVVGLAASSFLASLATAPIGAFHFQSLQVYGVAGNLLGAPIIELAAMPLAIVALLVAPFGFDRPVWGLVGVSIDLFIASAEWVATWPGGTFGAPAFPAAALACLVFGLTLAAILTTPLRFVGVAMATLALPIAATTERPLAAIDSAGETVLARGPDGRLALVSPKPNRFTLQRMLAADGDMRKSDDPSLVAARRCDDDGCTTPLRSGGRAAYALNAEAVGDDCREARIVFARLTAPQPCAAHLVNLAALPWTGAAHLLASPAGALKVATAFDAATARPWRRPPPPGPRPDLLTDAASRGPSAPPVADPSGEPPDSDDDQ